MNDKPTFTSFLPLLLVILGLIGWVGGEDYQISVEKAKINKQIADQEPVLSGTDASKVRYINFLKDLAATGEKGDPGAKLVMADALRAGIIQSRPATAAESTNAAPTSPTP